MGIPNGVSRVSIIGTLGGGEIFETGFWINEAPASQADANTLATTIENLFVLNALGGLKQSLALGHAYTKLKVYSYPTGGPSAAFIGEQDISGGAGSASGALPFQCTLVVTLRTARSGRRNRGRMYIPVTGLNVTPPLCELSNAQTDNVALSIGGFFTSLTAGPVAPIVVSQVGSSSTQITQVSCDNKIDIQRRRAKSLAPTYVKTVTL